MLVNSVGDAVGSRHAPLLPCSPATPKARAISSKRRSKKSFALVKPSYLPAHAQQKVPLANAPDRHGKGVTSRHGGTLRCKILVNPTRLFPHEMNDPNVYFCHGQTGAPIFQSTTYPVPRFAASIMKSQLANDTLGLMSWSERSTARLKAACAGRKCMPLW